MKKLLAATALTLLTLTACDTQDETPNTEAQEQKQETKSDYGQELQKAILEGNGKESFQDFGKDSPAQYINDLEEINAGTVRANIADTLDDTGKETTARWIFNMGCAVDDNLEAPLDTVVIRDTTGIDENFFANKMNPPVACD